MRDILIFNSEENYSNNLCLDIGGNEELLAFDKVTIWKNNLFSEITVYTENVLIVDKLETIINNIKEAEKIIFFPDVKKDKDICFIFYLLKNGLFENKNVLGLTKIFKFYCSSNIILNYKNEVYKDFNTSYSKVSSDIYLSDDEKEYVKYVINNQNKEHWFNDQNILIESEYKRIINLLNKKKITSKTGVFDPSILKVINGPTNPMYELSKITGLENIKHEVEKLRYTLEYQNKREKRGMKNENFSMHMCFYGNPGTGKTTVARIMTGLLFEMGYIKENKCIEINGLELKGNHIGQTATITKGVLDYAKGGVLFVDEAYTLYDRNERDFGKEAVNTFLKEMEDARNELIIIFAGYKKPMDRLLDTNAGFRSRIKKYFDFEDYSTLELTEIFVNTLKNKHLFITKEALERIIIIIKNARRKQNFGNGRYINNLIDRIEELHILNVEGSNNYSRIDTIYIEDVEEVTEL